MTRNGYVVVYRQTGKIQTSKTLQGIEVLAHEFIAVREDFAGYHRRAASEGAGMERTHSGIEPFVVSLSNHEPPFDRLSSNCQ